MGFRYPTRKGVADFLQEVTSRKDQEQYWYRRERPYRFVSVKQFADAFRSFHVGKSIQNELEEPFDRTRSHPAALAASKFGVSRMELLKATIDRELLLMKRNTFMFTFKAVNRDLIFFPAWAYTIPSWILQIPITFLEVGVYVFTTYYVIGFDPSVSRFAVYHPVPIRNTPSFAFVICPCDTYLASMSKRRKISCKKPISTDSPSNFPKYAYRLVPFTGLPLYVAETRSFVDVIGVVVGVSNSASIQDVNQNVLTVKRILISQDGRYITGC